MKKFILISIALVVFLSCEKKTNDTLTSEVTFSLNGTLLKNTSNVLVTNAKKLIISIKNENETVVCDYKVINLFKMNDDYISEPVALNPGNFKLTAFLVVDENDSIIYLSPRENSTLAYLVEDPLPKNFSVIKNETSKIDVEVITASIGSPSEFGYTSFEFNCIDIFTFCITSFEYSGISNDFVPTEADISISSNNKNIYTGLLNPSTNSIILPVRDEYTILISKPGFEDFITTIDFDSITDYNCANGGIPFIVIMNRLGLPVLEIQPGPETGMDAVIWDLKPDTNMAYSLELSAIAWTNQGRNSDVRSLIKFDLSSLPLETIVTKAELYLYGYNSHNNGYSRSLTAANYTLLCKVTSPWDEQSVTWRNQPAFNISDAILLDSCNTITDYKLDVTAHVQDMIQNPSQNNGWMLVLQNESYYQMMIFASSDNAINTIRPKLIIY